MRSCPSRWLVLLVVFTVTLVLAGCGGNSTPPVQPPPPGGGEPAPLTPIHHVIIVIGENHSFDNVFATYQPADPSQQVWNLLSQGIVDASGNPGPNFAVGAQQQATDTDFYRNSPPQSGAFATLPQPSTGVEPLLLSFHEQFLDLLRSGPCSRGPGSAQRRRRSERRSHTVPLDTGHAIPD